MNKTDKILVITESPHKAKVISKILKDAGYTNAKTISSVGHILKLADGNKKAFNSGIYPENDFKMNLKIAEDKYKVVEEIKAQAHQGQDRSPEKGTAFFAVILFAHGLTPVRLEKYIPILSQNFGIATINPLEVQENGKI